MSSIMLHVAIADRIRNKFRLGYEYVYGSILPDITKMQGIDRNLTHYITENINGVTEVPNLIEYKRNNSLTSEIEWGEYSHLIEDKIYFENYVSKMIEVVNNNKETILFKKDKTIHPFQDYINGMYSDFTNLNYYIIEENHLNIEEIQYNLLRIAETKDKPIIENTVKNHSKVADEFILFNRRYASAYVEECVKIVEEKLMSTKKYKKI